MVYLQNKLGYIALALCMVLHQSCIKEDLSRCRPTTGVVRIYFSDATEGAAAKASINPAEVDRINLYVFNSSGTLVEEYIDENPRLSPDYYIELLLAAGSYTFVAWGGVRNSYVITVNPMESGITTLSSCLLQLIRGPGNLVTNIPHPLFFGNILNAIVLPNQDDQRFNVALTQNTNRINVRTEGFPPSTDVFSLTITDDNGTYYFDNSFAPDELIHYTTICTKDAQGQLAASLTVMRLAENRPKPILVLTNETTSQVIFQANLIELILKLRDQGIDVNFNTMHEFNILLSFQADMSIKVNINGWELTEDGQEIH